MNTLIIFASVLAVALAAPGLAGLGAYPGFGAYSGLGAYGPYGYGGYYGGPYAGPLASGLTVAPVGRQVDPAAIAAGAPLPTGDTVEVAHAKAAHYQAYATEAARNGVYSYAAHATPLAYAHASPLAYNYAHAAPLAYSHGHVALASEAREIDPVAIAAGAPLPTGDTVEVAAAKAAHLHAHAAATAGHLRYKRGLAYAAHPLAYAAYAPSSFGYSSVTAHGSPLAYGAYNAPLVAGAHSYAYAPHSYAYASPISHYSRVW